MMNYLGRLALQTAATLFVFAEHLIRAITPKPAPPPEPDWDQLLRCSCCDYDPENDPA